MDKFKKYLKEEECACSGASGDIAPVDSKLLKKKKKPDAEIKENIDVNSDGKIDINDLIFMTQNLGGPALREVIDLVARYLIKKYEQGGDSVPGDGVWRSYANEAIIKKISGDKIVLMSGMPGYKVSSDGREVKMSDSDLKKRVLAAVAASKRRNARTRKGLEQEVEPDDIDDVDDIDDEFEDDKED